MPQKRAGKKAKSILPSHGIDPSISVPATQILQQFGVEPNAWDVLIVGDGSGTGWNNACGWSCVLVDRMLGLRKGLYGGMNAGTSYLAELIPYVQALSWYMDGPGRARLYDKMTAAPGALVHVHIVTDSEIVSRQGSGTAGRRKGRPYWSLIEAIEGEGYEIHWHWKGRNGLELNRLCDHMAGTCRKSLEAILAVQPPEGTTVYSYNPEP